ncbi:SAM-dependent methyltransferase [Anaerobacillus sp. HL2]|nr:SAM-dependent methyltransferase [Anaerobacillus sp. HL2]
MKKKGFSQFTSLKAYQEINKTDFEGIIFSNELIDALPIHVIEMQNSEIYEVFVTYDEKTERLIEEKKLCTNEDILLWLEKHGPILNEQQRIEIPLNMNKWIKEVDAFLKRGLLVTIDYGFTKEEWTMPQRKKGSLRGYYKHQLVNDPLLHPTEMDLTTHIHLDAYEAVLKEEGFVKVYDERNRFLLKIGLLKFLKENYDPNPFSQKSKQNRAIQTLLNDSGISAAFHVFLHGKNFQLVIYIAFSMRTHTKYK